jgi:hypothetical protein
MAKNKKYKTNLVTKYTDDVIRACDSDTLEIFASGLNLHKQEEEYDINSWGEFINEYPYGLYYEQD